MYVKGKKAETKKKEKIKKKTDKKVIFEYTICAI